MLKESRWHDERLLIPPEVMDWLQEVGSMTQRLRLHCQTLNVNVLHQGFVSADVLDADERAQLPLDSCYWLRQVILYGDNTPWLFGRTVVPQQSVTGEEQVLTQLGDKPLGEYLFQHTQRRRDPFYFTEVSLTGIPCWGRRSRLYLSGKPLLLSEVFLAGSPPYWRKQSLLPTEVCETDKGGATN
jgi:chorismate--pyruvate lyase